MIIAFPESDDVGFDPSTQTMNAIALLSFLPQRDRGKQELLEEL